MDLPSPTQLPPIQSEEPSFSANDDFGGLFGLDDAEGSPIVDSFAIHSVAGDDFSEVAVACQDLDWDDSSTGVPGSRFLSLNEGLERSWRNIPMAPAPKLPWQQGNRRRKLNPQPMNERRCLVNCCSKTVKWAN